MVLKYIIGRNHTIQSAVYLLRNIQKMVPVTTSNALYLRPRMGLFIQ